MTETANLALPEIAAAQAQKHVTHNEALRALDALVQLAVLDRTHAAPPGSPAEGQRWIVAASPTGAWAGHAGHVAAWQDGGWDFHVPRVGWLAYVIAEGALVAWSGSAWVDALAMLATLQNIALLGVGTTADATNPLSAKLNNALWVAKTVAEGGDGHLRTKMSKESAAKTLSLLLQTNFSGRAEIGLTGDDDLHVKVSADGASWLDALIVNKSTARLTLGQGFADPAVARAQVAAAPLDALAFGGMQINGSMDISQENGAAAVSLASGTAKYVLDQWRAKFVSGSLVMQAQQVPAPGAGIGAGAILNALQLKATTGAALGANDHAVLAQPIEGFRVQRCAFGAAGAQPVTIGFWVYATVAGTMSVAIQNGAANRSYVANVSVNNAATWEFKVVTVPGDQGGTWLGQAGIGLELLFCFGAGATFQAAANTWVAGNFFGTAATTNFFATSNNVAVVSGVIVLPGVEAPAAARAALIMRPSDVELRYCQRYFEKWSNENGSGYAGVGIGLASSTTVADHLFAYKAVKRVPPALAVSAIADFTVTTAGFTTPHTVTSSMTTRYPNEYQTFIVTTMSAASFTPAELTALQANNTTAAKLFFNARL